MAAQAAPAPWRQFAFFNTVPVKDPNDLGSSPALFKIPTEIAAITSTFPNLLVADIRGNIHVLNRSFDVVKSWLAYVNGRATHMIARNGILITFGEEESSLTPLLKVWNLDSKDKKSGAPVLLRSVKVQHGNRPHPISCLALTNNLSHLAVGLADGTVLLYRHISSSLQSNTSLTSFPKPRVIHESPSDSVTGLGFRETSDEGSPINLFIVTLSRTLVYVASPKGSASNATVVDEVGCDLGCTTMDWHKKEIVIARDEAIYLCGTEGRGTCIAYEGHKSFVRSHLNYLIIVSPPMSVSATHPSATVRNIAARTSSNGDITRVTIFDIENKFIAHTETFKEGVRDVFCQWEQVFVLTTDGKASNLSSLQEKPTSAELEILFQRSFYVVAINVAKTRSLDAASVADIHKRYGDHLYSKGDYDSAMQQFIRTIGHLQPSYVIRKFLDAQRIHNLTTYLQELHSLGLANSDHTTLLLNTYTKLKDVSRLDSFIKTESHRTVSGDPNDLPFDLQTAIRVCRQAGYFEHASYLAKKYERHEDYLRIQVEDTEKYADALDYVQKLGLEAAQNILIRYGRALLEHLPDETTTLLINICLGTSEAENPSVAMPIAKTAAGPSYLSYLALGRNNVTTNGDHPSPVPAIKESSSLKGHTVPNRESSTGFRDGSRTSSPQPSITNIRAPVKLPSPRLYFSHFVDHIAHFVRFLETIALKRWGQSVDSTTKNNIDILNNELYEDRIEQAAVWNTLLELYLTLFSESSLPGEIKLLEEKVVKLLQNQDLPYDHTHALIVCSTRRFTPGLVLLWEKMGMYEDILRFWMEREKENNDPEASFQVLHHLKLYGPSHPYLYPLVLRFLTSDERLLSQHVADLIEILDHIQDNGIMPPLGVIQVLSRNGATTVGLVKQWLMLRIREAQEETQADRSLIESYRSETKAKLQEISELTDTQNPRAFQATRCTACGSPLDLPAIHFMCKHSYHQRCLSEQEAECPECARSHGVIREIRRNNERLVDQHEIFLGDVAERGFSAVAAGFGKGVFNKLQQE